MMLSVKVVFEAKNNMNIHLFGCRNFYLQANIIITRRLKIS